MFINLFTWLLTCSHGYQSVHMFINPFTYLSTCSHGYQPVHMFIDLFTCLSTCVHVYQPVHTFINYTPSSAKFETYHLQFCPHSVHKTNNPLTDPQLSVNSPSEVSIAVADAMNSQQECIPGGCVPPAH